MARFDYQLKKREFIQHMDMLKSLDVEEDVFRRKYVEIAKDRTPLIDLTRARNRIWQPRDLLNEESTLKELAALEPIVVHVPKSKDKLHDEELSKDWKILRLYCHSMHDDSPPGRFLKFLVMDRLSKKYLGIVSIASDVISIKSRDDYIGWSSTIRRKKGNGRLTNSAIGACIIATQPFGFNFNGGKLVSAILTTKLVRDVWEREYGSKLVGFTTTALYGANSQYQNIPYWHPLEESQGKMLLTPDDRFLSPWRKHLGIQMEKGESGAKQKLVAKVMKELGMKSSSYRHGFKRGVYYAGVYSNFKEFLREEIEKDDLILDPMFAADVQGVVDWWKKDVALGRYKQLLKQGKLREDILFYNKLKKSETLAISYEEARSRYYRGVGKESKRNAVQNPPVS